MSEWKYQGLVFDPSEEELEKWTGFVYLIIDASGKKYIGKKNFWVKKKLKPLKGKRNKRISIVQSDWKDYYSSSNLLLESIEKHGKNSVTREILHLCRSKGEMSYLEVKEQMDRSVLLRDDYLNGIIQCRINHLHLKEMKEDWNKLWRS